MATDLHRPVKDILDPGPGATASGDAPEAAVRVEGLTRAFDGRAVIDDLDLTLRAGEFTALLGRSGCGKSTLLRVLAGLDREISGTVLVPRRRAVAFQAPRLMPWKRVWRNVLLGLPGKPERAVAERALAEVGLAERAGAWPKTLSGGEAQRASLARALVREPDLLLLDEPFGALDALTRIKAQQLVAELWQRRGCAVLLVTHDVDEALLLADRALVMREGRIAYDAPVALDRPRGVGSPGFAELRSRLLAELGVEGQGDPEAEDGPEGEGFPEGQDGPAGERLARGESRIPGHREPDTSAADGPPSGVAAPPRPNGPVVTKNPAASPAHPRHGDVS
ncbi:ABC transporter ATP-binding protein [Streptomyces sp. 43Y-GA-1]|uniref:ABC transporter ATP-binding protein n=1 Tax=Streptomyces sp. 43Y-GA-1 TaxID=2939435 RepID=UPI0020BFB348|nr:ABC transporter ATP-binding protein [Streptomyces sp. 43Y-GA-1]MCL6290845.1 ABC transporter ATP-binding protein [Streptomyces sp. 43Y-GA-1]